MEVIAADRVTLAILRLRVQDATLLEARQLVTEEMAWYHMWLLDPLLLAWHDKSHHILPFLALAG